MGFPVYDFRNPEHITNMLVTPQIRSRFLRMEPGTEAQGHTHDLGHEIFLILSGRCEFTIDGETEVLDPGQLCVALVDQWHQVRVVGDEPMIMYLSVTPHVQPTHTFWNEDGTRKPSRFSPNASYDVEVDESVDEDALLNRMVEANNAVQDATFKLSRAVGQTTFFDHYNRENIWVVMRDLHRQVARLDEVWNELAPRADD
ncbi:MAG: cupin domain-containing protein [Caldilineaceae bacterium]|nr:cupin domain-containing protein [Caldilineaceae bacterium]